MNLSAYVDGIGILGPGINNWPEAEAVLCGRRPYTSASTVLPTPALLPAAERRRTGRVVKLTLAVAIEATTRAGVSPTSLCSVFASSGGDGYNCHEICQALALPVRELSPTRFSNSVHNAAAGYWSIATGAMTASTALCAHDASFAAGLLEALTQVAVEQQALLLVAYDTDYPDPMRAKRPIPDAFAAALVLTPWRSAGSMARISAELGDAAGAGMTDPGLEAMRASIPAARSLPVLRQLALREPGRVMIDYLDGSRALVEIEPCA